MPHEPSKKQRAEMLSKNPEVFNANRNSLMPTNDIAKSFGQGDHQKAVKLPKVKRG